MLSFIRKENDVITQIEEGYNLDIDYYNNRVDKLKNEYNEHICRFRRQRCIVEKSLVHLRKEYELVKEKNNEFSDIFEKIKNRPEYKYKNINMIEFTWLPTQIDDVFEIEKFKHYEADLLDNPMIAIVSFHGFFKRKLFEYELKEFKEKVIKLEGEVNNSIYEIHNILTFLNNIGNLVTDFNLNLSKIRTVYSNNIYKLSKIIENKIDYNNFSKSERLVLENTVLLSDILFRMLKIRIINRSEKNKINKQEIDIFINNTKRTLKANNIDIDNW